MRVCVISRNTSSAGSGKQADWPLEFPAMSLGETQMRPTAMLFRNLLAMEVEESIRGNPIDRWYCSAAATKPRRVS